MHKFLSYMFFQKKIDILDDQIILYTTVFLADSNTVASGFITRQF